MRVIIKKGTTKATPREFGVWLNKIFIEKEAYFHDSARYTSGTNKLYGISYLNGDYAAFFWKFDDHLAKVKLKVQVHSKGRTTSRTIFSVPLSSWVNTKIKVRKNWYTFDVSYEGNFFTTSIKKERTNQIGFPINPRLEFTTVKDIHLQIINK